MAALKKDAPELLDFNAVMSRLGVNRKTVLRRIVSGQLPAYKIGSVWRFDPRDVEEFLNASKFVPPPTAVAMPDFRSRQCDDESEGTGRYS